jgi:glycosyltransferase involved in cell wall biosynthesis
MTDQLQPEALIEAAGGLRVLCVAKRWGHHTLSGGYERLGEAVGAEVIRRNTRGGMCWRIQNSLWWRLSHSKPYMLNYGYEDWRLERRALHLASQKSYDLVHVLYGDEQLELLLRQRRRLACPLIATFHLPPSRVSDRFEVVQKHLLPGIDMAIVIARNQLTAFRKWFGEDRVTYIPHGINTERFCPGDGRVRSSRIRLITSGHHMRDWDTLDKIIVQCQTLGLPVDFDIVGLEHGLLAAARQPNVHFHRGIPEEQLIELYRQADALLMPINDCTATNATLEALACGAPVISNRIGGMPDYVDDTCGWLFDKGEVAGVVNLIGDVCRDPHIASSRRPAARSKGLSFSWQLVARKMQLVYDAVTHGRCLTGDIAESPNK